MILAVIGAGGFLGGHIAWKFRALGHEVIPIGRGEPLFARAVDVAVDCNGDPRRFWANANPEASHAANVDSVAARLDRMRYTFYVYASTVDVYGSLRADRTKNVETAVIDVESLDTYALHKHMAEELVRQKAPNHLILRLGTLIGPGLKKNPVYDALHGHRIRQTRTSTLSLVDLDHVGRALERLLLANARGTFNVTGARSIDIASMLGLIGDRVGHDDFQFDPDLIHTEYDVNIDEMAEILPLPDSAAMLRSYLDHEASADR